MNWSRFVRNAAAVLLLAEVFGVTLYVAARVGPFAALLGVAIFGLAWVVMRIRTGAARIA
jgi:hypothetical protein